MGGGAQASGWVIGSEHETECRGSRVFSCRAGLLLDLLSLNSVAGHAPACHPPGIHERWGAPSQTMDLLLFCSLRTAHQLCCMQQLQRCCAKHPSKRHRPPPAALPPAGAAACSSLEALLHGVASPCHWNSHNLPAHQPALPEYQTCFVSASTCSLAPPGLQWLKLPLTATASQPSSPATHQPTGPGNWLICIQTGICKHACLPSQPPRCLATSQPARPIADLHATCLPSCPPACLPACPLACLPPCLPAGQSARLPACLAARLSPACLPACMHAMPSTGLPDGLLCLHAACHSA